MSTLHDLYQQNPFWVWLAAGALFVAFDITSGNGKLIWPGVAAAILALLNLATVRLGVIGELVLFSLICLLGLFLGPVIRHRPTSAPPTPPPTVRAPPPAAPPPGPAPIDLASHAKTARLIGRIGRATGEFVNGVGLIWIDGAEWSAQIDEDEAPPAPDAPVRVMGVTGSSRLHVRGLMAG